MDAGAAAEGGRRPGVRARAVHDALGLRRGRGADLDQRRPEQQRHARAHGPGGRAGDRGDLRGRRRRGARRARPVRHAVAGRARSTARTSWSSPAASAWRRCARRSSRCWPSASATAASCCSTAGARPTSCCSATSCEQWGERGLAGDRHRRQRRARSGSATSASSRGWCTAPSFDAARAVALLCGPEVMMRFTVVGAGGARRRRRARLRLDGAQHAVRHRALRSLPARADVPVPRRPGLPRGASSRRGWRSGSCDGRASASRRSPSGSSPPATAAS